MNRFIASLTVALVAGLIPATKAWVSMPARHNAVSLTRRWAMKHHYHDIQRVEPVFPPDVSKTPIAAAASSVTKALAMAMFVGTICLGPGPMAATAAPDTVSLDALIVAKKPSSKIAILESKLAAQEKYIDDKFAEQKKYTEDKFAEQKKYVDTLEAQVNRNFMANVIGPVLGTTVTYGSVAIYSWISKQGKQ